MKAQQILIAGPYRSGTDGDPQRIAANLTRLEQAALAVYQRGHVPVIGEWLALPLASAAGSTQVGDAVSEAFLYPVAHRLIAQCQAVYRIEGASAGADNDVRLANEWGLMVYRHLEEIPSVQA
ncbi:MULTISPECIES: NUDIX hydrolase [Serratia]|uniref:NUDIX hydrolase n=1 Tax=Serratia TaxID=613 RepID=UPI00063AB770|nr:MULTISPECIES: NUDIX hydrolase [Serratia]KLE37386.1 NUDIX hydrolase [Serratia sp. TEL]MBH2686081.1 NUDIX hydrolase [Serratia ureilytica]MBZ0045762.1 NUDIX hydrolase [Serratia sp. EWG9]MDP8754142.1 NUDIX hydrolase [Serratia marcescens]MDP8758803.1 NUDIX hydrolase [Serratia marcescens]